MLLLSILIMFPLSLGATTHLWFWVNGDTSHTLTQGDNFAWELDLAAPGNSVDMELYLDLDASRTINEGDFLLGLFTIIDGEQEDGPSDSSAVPDGIIYLQFGPFGFAPQNYVLRGTDMDESKVTNWFVINAMQNPPATASGTIMIEGTGKPNPMYENIMIAAMGENGMFSGLTDASGDYTINLPVANANWQIGTIFDNTLPGYTMNPRGYELSIPAGNTGSLDFSFSLPSSYVYGTILDQDGKIIDRNGWVYLRNQTTGSETEARVDGGHYLIPAMVVIQGTDSVNTFRMGTDDRMLVPEYLNPNDNKEFQVSWGDSMEYNLIAYQTDSKIYGYVTENGDNPSKKYQFSAWSDSLGSTITESDPTSGYFELSVRTGTSYNVWLQDDPQWGTPPPPGYIIEKNWQFAMPGNTVYFNLIPAGAAIAGTITFDPGDPADLNYERCRVSASDSTFTSSYSSRIDKSNNFFIPVADGKYEVIFDQDYNEYLAMPARFTGVTVKGDTIDTLNFELNYAHAQLAVKLTGDVPIDQAGHYWIRTTGEWPMYYEAGAELLSDSTYRLRVCEGEWYLYPPINVNLQEYAVTPSESFLMVTENDSSYYVEFNYKLLTGLETNKQIPASFYLNQNYPNPFNPSTTISYGLMKAAQVKLEIFNIRGQRVESLVNGHQNAGTYQVVWNPTNLASGVYLYRLETAGFVQTRKLILIR